MSGNLNLTKSPSATQPTLLSSSDDEDVVLNLCNENTEGCKKTLQYKSNCHMVSTSVQSLHDGMAMRAGNFKKLEVSDNPSLTVKEEIDDPKYSPEHPRMELKCGMCSEKFQYVSELIFHEQTHNGINHFECQLCGRHFQSTSNLKDHYNVHTGERPYKCELCAKAFTQSSSLLTHKRTHTMEKSYKCEVCGRTFKDASNFIKHSCLHGQIQDLTKQAQMRGPFMSEKPYACSYCEKAFKRSSDLKDHERVHTGERPYCCRICQKCFTQSSVLTGHMRIHTGERPFHCDVCGKTFNNSSNFKKHQRTHSMQDMLAKVKIDDDFLHLKQPLRSKNGIGYPKDISAALYSIDRSCPLTLPKFTLTQEVSKYVPDNTEGNDDDDAMIVDEQKPPCVGITNMNLKSTAKKYSEEREIRPVPLVHSHGNAVIVPEGSNSNVETEAKGNSSLKDLENSIKPKLLRSAEYCSKDVILYETENVLDRTKPTQELYVEISDDDSTDSDDDLVDYAKYSFQCQIQDRKVKSEENAKCLPCGDDHAIPTGESAHCEAENDQDTITEDYLEGDATDLAESENLLLERTMDCWDSPFDDSVDLYDSRFLESESKPYICFVCSKRFKRATDLKEHLRVHTGERPFVCQVCGKGFTQSSALSSHQRIHTGEKPFQCDVCYKRFNNSSNFSKHKRVHTGERPHNCPLCGKSFQEKRRVKRHLKAVHNVQE